MPVFSGPSSDPPPAETEINSWVINMDAGNNITSVWLYFNDVNKIQILPAIAGSVNEYINSVIILYKLPDDIKELCIFLAACNMVTLSFPNAFFLNEYSFGLIKTP